MNMKTPNSNRIHIGIFGVRNAGKSTLFNYLLDQDASLVSHYPGTTTDTVQKAMEIHGLGPVLFIDTAGLDDVGYLGEKRIEKTRQAMDKCDIAIYLHSTDHQRLNDNLKNKSKIQSINDDSKNEGEDKKKTDKTNEDKISNSSIEDINDINFIDELKQKEIPVIEVEIPNNTLSWTKNSKLRDEIFDKIRKIAPKGEKDITGNLVDFGSLVILVMPQDSQAPKGRLILPQVQTIREILDKKALSLCVTPENLQTALNSLSKKPDLVITDSQVFDQVNEILPKDIKLTSFSILFAALKGDIDYFIKSTDAFDKLNDKSKVLICEACTHPPMDEDIGTVKIPNMLRKKFGDMDIDFVRGADFPSELKNYDLIIHCGSCMFNRAHVLSRVKEAKKQDVPMTNYGITIAKVKGILGKVIIPR